MYGVNNDLLLFYIPEECSSLNVYSSVSQSARLSCSEKDPAMSSETPPCSTQSTYTSMSTSSIGTEELDLLSQSSTSEEGQDEIEGLSIDSICPHLEAPEAHCTEHINTQNKRENSYVTMSSFHHIRTARAAGVTSPMKLIVSWSWQGSFYLNIINITSGKCVNVHWMHTKVIHSSIRTQRHTVHNL